MIENGVGSYGPRNAASILRSQSRIRGAARAGLARVRGPDPGREEFPPAFYASGLREATWAGAGNDGCTHDCRPSRGLPNPSWNSIKAPGGQPGVPGLKFSRFMFLQEGGSLHSVVEGTRPAPCDQYCTQVSRQFPSPGQSGHVLTPRRNPCGSRDAVASEISRVCFQHRVSDMSGVDVNVW